MLRKGKLNDVQTDDNSMMVDCIGLACPLPVLKARKALRLAAPGTLVKVFTTDPMARIDIPHMVREDGHVLVEEHRESEHDLFVIRAS